jgi:hypothetical protein
MRNQKKNIGLENYQSLIYSNFQLLLCNVGSKNILSVFISNASYVDKLATAKFIQNEKEAQLIPLTRVKNNIYMSPPIDLPEKSFKIAIEGTDKSQNDIRRMISTSLISTEPCKKLKYFLHCSFIQNSSIFAIIFAQKIATTNQKRIN